MANNYLQFSETIDDLTAEEYAWLKEVVLWSPPEEIPEGFQWPAWWDDDAEHLGFDFDLRADTFWVYAEESGNLDTLAELLLQFITKFRPDEVFTLTWAETCSKMRIGQFSGGAMVVSKDGVEFFNATTWARQQVAKIRDKAEAEAEDKALRGEEAR